MLLKSQIMASVRCLSGVFAAEDQNVYTGQYGADCYSSSTMGHVM